MQPFIRFRLLLEKRVEANMKSVHDHLRRKDCDEPIPDLRLEDLPTTRHLDSTSVKLTFKTCVPRVVREERFLQIESPNVDAEPSWLLDLATMSQVAVVRNERTGSLLVATRVASPAALVHVLREVLISKGRPGRIICDCEAASEIRDWAKIYGVEVVTQPQVQLPTASLDEEASRVTAESQHNPPREKKKTVASEKPWGHETKVKLIG